MARTGYDVLVGIAQGFSGLAQDLHKTRIKGHKVKGLPRFTLTRGQVAVQDGVVQTQEGHGQFVARAPRPAVNRALSAWKDLTAPRPVQRSGVPATGV